MNDTLTTNRILAAILKHAILQTGLIAKTGMGPLRDEETLEALNLANADMEFCVELINRLNEAGE